MDMSAAFNLVDGLVLPSWLVAQVPYNLVLQLHVQVIAATADAADVIMLGIPVNQNY